MATPSCARRWTTVGVEVTAKVTNVQNWTSTVPDDYKDAPRCRNALWATGSSRNYEDTDHAAVREFRDATKGLKTHSQWQLEGWAAAMWFTDAARSCARTGVTRACVDRFMDRSEGYTARRTAAPRHVRAAGRAAEDPQDLSVGGPLGGRPGVGHPGGHERHLLRRAAAVLSAMSHRPRAKVRRTGRNVRLFFSPPPRRLRGRTDDRVRAPRRTRGGPPAAHPDRDGRLRAALRTRADRRRAPAPGTRPHRPARAHRPHPEAGELLPRCSWRRRTARRRAGPYYTRGQRPVGDRRRVPLSAGAEELPDVGDQQLRLLQRGEVAAAVELGPAHDGVVQLGAAPDADVVGERRHPGRDPERRRRAAGVRVS